MAHWFCFMFNVVFVVKRLFSPRCRSELIDSAWVVFVSGPKCIKSFDECIVAELRFGRNKICFTVLYRNPIHKVGSPEFFNFIDNFRDLHSKMSSEKPYFLIFPGDFIAHSVQWWPNGDSNNERTQLNLLFSELGLTQLISEPTHFRENCQPSCIDLIINDQPNLVSDSGVRSSLDQTCKHQITYCKLGIKSPRIPASK